MAPADFRKQPNLYLLITDQQSGHRHWPQLQLGTRDQP